MRAPVSFGDGRSQVKCGVLQPPTYVTPRSIARSRSTVIPYRGGWLVPRAFYLPILSAVVLASACDDPSAPLGGLSSYVARSLEGMPLPATLLHGDMSDLALLADTIHLYPHGVAERISIRRLTTLGAPVAVDTARTHNAYAVTGDSLHFDEDCPPNAFCIGAPRGSFSDDRRTLQLRMWPDGPAALYERVSP